MSRPEQLEVDQGSQGSRLDLFLTAALEDVSRTLAARAVKQGLVSIDGKTCLQPGRRMRAGETVLFTPPEPERLSAEAEDLPISVVFEDRSITVVDKQAGMAVHPSRGHASGTLVNALVGRWGFEPGAGDLRPGIVHRLDLGTSGLLVAARTSKARDSLQRAFADRRVTKIYLAICLGTMKQDRGLCDSPISRHPKERKRFTSRTGEGRTALTEWSLIENGRSISLLAIRLHSGRTHQIRVHLSDLGHAIAGDALYGGEVTRIQERRDREALSPAGRPLLHSAFLSFAHPATRKRLELVACPPQDFLDPVTRLLTRDTQALLSEPEALKSYLKALFTDSPEE